MSNEIARKFLIKNMPDLSSCKSASFERYYIYIDNNIELRVQKNGEKYELERKEIISKLKAVKTTLEISKPEFEQLKTLGTQVILREQFSISSDPEVCIQIYHGKYEGLKRVEVEFSTEEAAQTFQIPDWYGKEITDSVVSRDSKLLNITEAELKSFIL